MQLVAGQPSFRIATDTAEAFVTRLGGHVAPVTFQLGGRRIQPFHIAPWAEEGPTGEPPIIDVLRGDFFCMPFGGNETPYRGERHPIHGQTANEPWDLVSLEADTIEMRLRTTIRPGEVVKRISLRDNALYSRHTITGMEGPMSFGHHAMLRFRSPGLVSCSPFAWGQVYPFEFESPVKGGYSSLKQGARFDDLEQVPLASGGSDDLSRYPAREGFEDLVMVSSQNDTPLAWTAVAFPEEGYVFISLKNRSVLPSTVLWHSNGGRHYAPWSGRHRSVLGIEEVCSYFHTGLAESAAPNPVSEAGIRTCHLLSPDRPLAVSTILAVAEIPSEFGHVRTVSPTSEGAILADADGRETLLAFDPSFLKDPS
jgi:hypothetical protein